MKYITVKLTEDQIRAIESLIDDHQVTHKLMMWHEKSPEQEKEYAFLQRLRQALKQS